MTRKLSLLVQPLRSRLVLKVVLALGVLWEWMVDLTADLWTVLLDHVIIRLHMILLSGMRVFWPNQRCTPPTILHESTIGRLDKALLR